MTPGPSTSTRRYAPGDTGVYDVWLPDPSAVAPGTVVLVHGGFWKAIYDRHHLEPLADALATDGWAVASLEYPRVGMPDGGYPGTLTAVRAGLEAVAADPDLPHPIVVVGHSAGGHLAAWATTPRAPGVAGGVSLAGVLDLTLADDLGLGGGAVAALLGESGAEPTTWDDADPARRPRVTPLIAIHGTEDEDVPVAISQSYLAARAGDAAPARLHTLDGVGHMDLIDPTHAAYDALVAAVAALAEPDRPAGPAYA